MSRLDLATDSVALQSAMNSDRKLIFRYRLSLGSFIFGLIVSGLTAFPLELETALLNRLFGIHQGINPTSIFFKVRLFISVVHYAIHDTYTRFPFFWTLIDCSFGVVGAIPLLYCLRLTRKIDNKL